MTFRKKRKISDQKSIDEFIVIIKSIRVIRTGLLQRHHSDELTGFCLEVEANAGYMLYTFHTMSYDPEYDVETVWLTAEGKPKPKLHVGQTIRISARIAHSHSSTVKILGSVTLLEVLS